MGWNRKIVTVRHGERVDFTFTDDWPKHCFDNQGNYTRQNLNQPEKVPVREGSPESFIYDTPLTEVGCLQSRLIGKGLAKERILGEFEVYVSPALRCIETATHLLRGMGLNPKLNIEPCLFEWTQWYVGRMPKWMSYEELKNAGFNIDCCYKPFMSLEGLNDGETIEAYYDRSHKLMRHLLKKDGDRDLLLIAHGSSLDTNSRQLLGYQSRTEQDMYSVLRGIPYAGVAVMEEDATGGWKLLDVPKLHICHASEHDFDAKRVFYDDGTRTVSNLTPPRSRITHK